MSMGFLQDMSTFLEEEVIRKTHVEVIVVGKVIVLGKELELFDEGLRSVIEGLKHVSSWASSLTEKRT